ncbi:hypothetical protein N9Y50_08170 [Alphaproteobacteria bacterium]|nr:hypothetical protein [Alphaproteobacteria bacterium]
MDYKNEMRKLIDIVKQQSFEAKLEDTLDDLLTLTTATKDLSDRISTRVRKSLQPNDKEKKKTNKSSTAKTVKSFPSITPLPIPKSKNLPTSNAVSSTATSAKDIDNVRKDFMAKQQAVQPIKAQGTVGALSF